MRHSHLWFHIPVLPEFWNTVIPLRWLEPINYPELCSPVGQLIAISILSVSLQTLPCCYIINSLSNTDYSSSSQHRSLSLSHIFSRWRTYWYFSQAPFICFYFIPTYPAFWDTTFFADLSFPSVLALPTNIFSVMITHQIRHNAFPDCFFTFVWDISSR